MKILRALYNEMEFSKPTVEGELPYYVIIIGILTLFTTFMFGIHLK